MSTDETQQAEPLSLPRKIAHCLFFVAALYFFAHLSWYYMTGAGGPTRLAVAMVPMTVVLVFLNDARRGELYPRLGHWGGLLAAVVYSGICLWASYYILSEFDAIRIFRVGFWDRADYLAGGAIAALVLEYTRRKYFALFVVNLTLLVYTIYGYMIPGLFNHPGISFNRAVSAVSIEMSTGVFERLSQLGLTLIGSFILVLAVLRAFDCIDSILKGSARLAARSPAMLPQTAVVGSFAVAAVSGSGAANAATTGTATIPALIRSGFPRVKAAAVETASSLGGQLMPPLMGIAAFMMAEIMGVSYFDVVARGFGPAMIYFLGVCVAVYLLAVRYQRKAVMPKVEPMKMLDWVNIAAYLLGVCGLIYLMGFERKAAMTSAQTVFVYLAIGLGTLFLAQRIWQRNWHPKELIRPFHKMVDTFALTTAELTILLATLGILTAAFTVTGVPTKVGILVMEVASINLVLMVLVAFAFGYLVGMGLPVAPTYIVVAVVIAPFMIRAGIDPWVVHFFAFFVAVFGELSPPTSVTAAVTSRIAEAPFVRTMIDSLGLCIPLIVMMFAVFTRPELVLEPGVAQLGAIFLVSVGTLGIIFGLQGRFHSNTSMDRLLRLSLIAISLLTLFHPDNTMSLMASLVVLAGLGAGLFRAYRARQEVLSDAPVEEVDIVVSKGG
ncbi:TRAP transporter 4TM/12TM fusion protein [Natronocella acetinitrilica]|uniref:TRAP transporter 4TM/12TM fusion protein n=1 Tax=Natronocella acetinitrilica TaxID=414046 RepID=A0AAE3KC65_9GAMM|nr:TRAP transporter fused permease subunit [Natronocella acetinitrilica]MCP1675409.1 TRAP transporter 4TM/12TM fusion protein [Natronocella acetinitrilica]